MLNSKDGFFGKRDDKVRKDVGSVYGMSSGSSSTSSSSSVSSSSPGLAPAMPTAEAVKSRTEQPPAPEETKGNRLIVGPTSS